MDYGLDLDKDSDPLGPSACNYIGTWYQAVFARKYHSGKKYPGKPRKRAVNVGKNTYDHIWQNPRANCGQLLYASDIF